MKDKLFSEPASKQFVFDAAVAGVFDDMIGRSVPMYQASGELCARFLARILPPGARVIDFGCSTATFLLQLGAMRADLELFGVDNSPAMLQKAAAKAQEAGREINFLCSNLCDFSALNLGADAYDAAVCAYTLQFLRPLKREEFLRNVYQILRPDATLLLSEKLLYEEPRLQKHAIDEYEDYKASQGYSRGEIAAKRAALENVLIPFSAAENRQLLRAAGFKFCDELCRWLNFATFLATK